MIFHSATNDFLKPGDKLHWRFNPEALYVVRRVDHEAIDCDTPEGYTREFEASRFIETCASELIEAVRKTVSFLESLGTTQDDARKIELIRDSRRTLATFPPDRR